MQINIRTSEANQEVIRKLTSKLPSGTKENVVARIALSYSLQSNRKFSTSEFNIYDSKGKEYKDHILFDSKYRDFYIALVCQSYHVYKTNENIPKYIKLHIDHGLELMSSLFDSNSNYTFFDFLIEHLDKGISMLDNTQVNLNAVKNNSQNIEKSHFDGLLKLEVGSNNINSEQIILNFNDTNLYSNNHIAVAGSSGTGKTQFALSLLKDITERSNHLVNFIYLDFKGLKNEDISLLKPFFDATKAKFIDIPSKPFPVNPLAFIDSINTVNRQMGIDKFVDIICKYSNIGIKQRGKLREAVYETFISKRPGEYPTLSEINEKLLEIVDDKQDSLTEILDELSRYDIFKQDKKSKNFLNENIYLSLSGNLSNSVRFTSLFLIINYIYNVFMNMDNTEAANGYRAMRYVLLIDEAHVIFKEKKYQDILEKMLREIRSKGVSVILLSQGIEEFNQPNFDFSSMCEISFLLNIKDKTNTKAINKFLGLSEGNSAKVCRSLERMKKGETVSNIKELPKGEMFTIKQYHNN
ncbi:DndE family protein [Taibaiella chishuiensis]|uniref:DNA sulfur modification protein DndE n=1 Tax=Taibaiella chishuiensis TaxID=1434707 RepID=A0A2P8D630_9BACT|nr:DndE family protein [Taibaiella chishuiensis]PSK92674.1 DNA sulfur modification protein DndE [Taibaiella chishuiensis]